MPNTPARGTETCNVVETMWSMVRVLLMYSMQVRRYAIRRSRRNKSCMAQEVAFSISGNLSYADRLERLALNALPAALWPDLKANTYLQMTNEIVAIESPVHYWQHDGPKSTIYGLHRCCTSNFNQGCE